MVVSWARVIVSKAISINEIPPKITITFSTTKWSIAKHNAFVIPNPDATFTAVHH